MGETEIELLVRQHCFKNKNKSHFRGEKKTAQKEVIINVKYPPWEKTLPRVSQNPLEASIN